MRKIERLRKEALESCEFRGHSMKPFSRKYRHWWDAECRTCGKTVHINDNPPPNGIDISGEAIALGCQDSERVSLLPCPHSEHCGMMTEKGELCPNCTDEELNDLVLDDMNNATPEKLGAK